MLSLSLSLDTLPLDAVDLSIFQRTGSELLDRFPHLQKQKPKAVNRS